MTKKRFKLSMAALGLLAAFFMVLIAVLLAPTLASANKEGGKHHNGMPDAGYPHGGRGGASHGPNSGEDWNAFGHEHGNAYDTPFCVEGGVYPCAILSDPDAFDGGDPDSFESGYPGGGNPQHGDGSPNRGGQYNPTFWGGGGAPGGGNGGGPGGGNGGGPGGGNGGGPGAGNGPADEKCGKADEDQSGNSISEQDGEEIKSCDTDTTSTNLTLETSGDLPSGFVDPNFGDDDKSKTEDGPQGGPQGGPEGENPPTTELAVTEVPEPLTLSLFAVGLAGAASLRRRSRRA